MSPEFLLIGTPELLLTAWFAGFIPRKNPLCQDSYRPPC